MNPRAALGTKPVRRSPSHAAGKAGPTHAGSIAKWPAAAALALWLSAGPAGAQVVAPLRPPSGVVQAAESGARWEQLTPAQRSALQPLQREWSSIDAPSKAKWLELSTRLPSMTADERARVQTRMSDWARLTPLERGRARLNFEEAKQMPSQDRQARWEAYQALPPERKRELAERGAPSEPARRGSALARSLDGAASGARETAQGKSNIVPNPAFAAPPRPVAPTVVQASPGATTTLVTKRPVPPAHQQTGMPKIVASPEFVNRATLLPQRGPQGAAARSSTPPSAPQP